MTPTTTAQTRPMLDGRHDDSRRRRQRVLAVVDQAAAAGDPISASAIARAAGVDRTFHYRHRDLLEKIHALQADPVPDMNSDHTVTHASLRADLLAAHERAARPSTPASTNWRNGFPRRSANIPGASPGSVPPSTSTHSTSASASSNNTTTTFNNNSTNATTTWPPPAPPTENSWPD
jgi:hypothetical protein